MTPTRRRFGPARSNHGPALAAVLGSALILAACTGGSGVPTVPPGSASVSAGPSAAGSAGPDTACPTAEPPVMPSGSDRLVSLDTRLGTIVITVHGDWSPIAAANFVSLAGCGFYDGVGFHRVATLGDGSPFVIQGGDPTGSGSGGPGYTIADEPLTVAYARGIVAMARTNAPHSEGSQFFIVLSDAAVPILASYGTYAIFGEVTAGMDVADAIYADADGELPTKPVLMDDVSVTTP